MTDENKQEIDQEEQDFQAALLEDEVDAPRAPEPEPAKQDEPEVEEKEEGEAEPESEPEETPFNPAEEIQRLRSALEKTNGTYGSQLQALRKQIETLTAPRQKDEAPAEKAAKVEVTADRLAKLKGEFPELADLLAQDLSDLLAAPAQAGEADAIAEIRQQIQEDRAAREEKARLREIRMLSREHPDWQDIAKYTPDENGLVRWSNPAFGQWVMAQPENVQNEILNSDDALELADHLTAYKKTLKPATKQSNLTKAVQPRGQPGVARPSAMDEEEQLYREELEREEY